MPRRPWNWIDWFCRDINNSLQNQPFKIVLILNFFNLLYIFSKLLTSLSKNRRCREKMFYRILSSWKFDEFASIFFVDKWRLNRLLKWNESFGSTLDHHWTPNGYDDWKSRYYVAFHELWWEDDSQCCTNVLFSCRYLLRYIWHSRYSEVPQIISRVRSGRGRVVFFVTFYFACRKKFNFLKFSLSRFVRFVPSLGIVFMLFMSSLSKKLVSGPQMLDLQEEQEGCRQYWLGSLLLMRNFNDNLVSQF